MPHLLSAEATEEIQAASEAAASEAAAEETAAASTLTSLEELPPPPTTHDELIYRLAQMEMRVLQLETSLQAAAQMTQEQASELAATEAQLEIQEEALSSLAEEEGDPEEACQGDHPPLWCRLLGGQKAHR